jgi:hypothetical protein
MISLAAASFPVRDLTVYADSSVAQCTRLIQLSLPVSLISLALNPTGLTTDGRR